MLKLAYSRKRNVRIITHDKESRFSSDLIRALGIAIFLHIAGFIIFNIQDVDTPELKIIAPISVRTESGSGNTSDDGENIASIQIDKHGLLPRYIAEPEMSLPSLPEMPKMALDNKIMHTREDQSLGGHFSQIEYETAVDKEQLSFLRDQKTCNVHVSGGLADLSLLPYNIDPQYLIEISQNSPGQFRTIFAVKVENKTGEIFWYTQQQPSKLQRINKLAEKILRQLRFTPSRNTLITEGTVEFTFIF